MASHESESESESGAGRVLPLLPLRDIVVFPHMVVPLFVGREKSVRALEEAMERDRSLLLSAQRDARADNPGEDDIYSVGTLGVIVQLVKLPDGTVKVLVEGKQRARIVGYEPMEEYFLVRAQPIDEDEEMTVEAEALIRSIIGSFETYVKLN